MMYLVSQARRECLQPEGLNLNPAVWLCDSMGKHARCVSLRWSNMLVWRPGQVKRQ